MCAIAHEGIDNRRYGVVEPISTIPTLIQACQQLNQDRWVHTHGLQIAGASTPIHVSRRWTHHNVTRYSLCALALHCDRLSTWCVEIDIKNKNSLAIIPAQSV